MTRTGLLLASLAAAWAASATAEPNGQRIYTTGSSNVPSTACSTCHGADGMGLPGTDFPRIAGLPAGYILRQLHDLGDSNRRDAPVMKTIVSAFSEEELQAVANSVSQMPVSFTAKALTGAERPRTAGEALALQGDWTRNIPACTACHGPDGVGVGEAFPALQGQNAGYLSSQLSAWQRGARKNDPNDLMGAVARSLSAAEIRSVSDYFANLPLDGGRP